MSVQSQLEGIQREIERLQRRLAQKSQEEATKTGRLASISGSMSRTNSVATLQSKQRQLNTLNRDIARIQKEKADLSKRIADKTSRLYRLQGDLHKEQSRDWKKLQESLVLRSQEQQRQQDELLGKLQSSAGEPGDSEQVRQNSHDAFISHASEDKEELVRPLADALVGRGLDVWYDEFQLKVGDSLRRSIDRGLASSRFGIVVLSPSFFEKNWPQYELDGLVAKEITGGKVILPLWHKLSKNEVMNYSPTLADRVALNTSTATIEELAMQLVDAMA